MTKAIILLTLILSGCGTVNSFVSAQNAIAVRDAQTANDNLVKGIEEGICAVPVGAVFRNAEFIPIAQASCLGAGANTNPQGLLQAATTANGGAVPAYELNNPALAAVRATSSVAAKPVIRKPKLRATVPVSAAAQAMPTRAQEIKLYKSITTTMPPSALP